MFSALACIHLFQLLMTPLEHDFAQSMRRFEEAGVLPEFVSAAICKPWPRPVPGPSLIVSVCRSQMRHGTWPEDTGSLYMPPPGALAPEVADIGKVQRRALHAEEAMREGALIELRDLDFARDNLIATVDLGNLATSRLKEQILNNDMATIEAVARHTRGSSPRAPKAAPVKEEKSAVQEACEAAQKLCDENARELEKAERSPRERVLKLGAPELIRVMTRGNAAALMLTRVAGLRMKCVTRLVEYYRQADRKLEFLADRAQNICAGAMLELDRVYTNVGFGAWMPFRFADQYLMFGSAMRKLFAANGLITPKGPNHWKKFLEETPEVPLEKEWPQAPLEMPESWGVRPADKAMKFEDLERPPPK